MKSDSIPIDKLLFEDEGTALDFKSAQYSFSGASDDEKGELLKDILVFANSFRRTDAYILIGVKQNPGSKGTVEGVGQHLEDAALQQFVNSKTQRPIGFSYLAATIDGKQGLELPFARGLRGRSASFSGRDCVSGGALRLQRRIRAGRVNAMAKTDRTTIPPIAPAAIASLGDALRAQGIHVTDAGSATVALPVDGDLARSRKLVVRRERKGHGGKTVTVIEGLALSAVQLDAMAQRMRKALGCGSWVDGARVILQGDRAPGAEAWLRANGAALVVRGN